MISSVDIARFRGSRAEDLSTLEFRHNVGYTSLVLWAHADFVWNQKFFC